MKKKLLLLSVAAALAAPTLARAAQDVSFEESVGLTMLRAAELREDQQEIMSAGQAARIDELADETLNLSQEYASLRDQVATLRNRAQVYVPPRPRDGSWNPDPFFRDDLRAMIADAQRFSHALELWQGKIRELAGGLSKDPLLVPPAQRLHANARTALRGYSRTIKDDAVFLCLELRRMGYESDAWAVERTTQNARSSAAGVELEAKILLDKVR